MILSGTSLLLVVTSLLLVWCKSIRSAIHILALQSCFLCIAAGTIAWLTGESDLYIVATLTLLIKAIAIPGVLDATMRRIAIRKDAEKFVGRELSLLIAAGLVVFSYAMTMRLGAMFAGSEMAFSPYLADAIALLLIGLFIMVAHKKAIMQGIGLVVIENGLFLFALSTASGMPFIVEIGIFLDVFVSVILISILSYRMDRTFKSLSTDWLRKLKG
jgi:hydrogenase-4 component E